MSLFIDVLTMRITSPLFSILLTSLAFACTSTSVKMVKLTDDSPYFGKEAWLAERAKSLGTNIEQARLRDDNFSESKPPVTDQTVQAQSARIWKKNCAACHGLTGKSENTPSFTPPPRKFGTMGMSMGFFFGGDKMRAGIYRTIKNGKGQNMPAYGDKLAREQIWGLVKFIEGL